MGRSAVLLLSSAATSSAQVSGTTATLRGAVDDASGGVLQGATITLVNTATLATRTAVSDERGAFAFSSLFPGTYDLRCELSGFTTTEHRGIVLSPNDSRGVAIRLEIAGQSEVVAVRAAPAEALRTETGAREGVLTAHQIDNLSIIGRSSLELLRILPGVVAPDQNQLESVSFFGGSNNTWGYTVNGIRSSNNTVSLDGSNLVEASCNCGLMTGVNNDMVQEVKVQSSNFGAEFGSGAVSVSAVTKSGSSKLSGSLYDYARDWHVAANDRSNSITGVEKPKSRFNYPGGNIGGPIPLPFSGYNAKQGQAVLLVRAGGAAPGRGLRQPAEHHDQRRGADRRSERVPRQSRPEPESPRRRADPGLVSRRGHTGARQRSRAVRDAARPRDGQPVSAPELRGCRQSLQLRLQRPRADQPDGGEGAIRLEHQRRHEGVRPDLARSRRHRRASRPLGEQRVRTGTADSRPRHQSRALVRRQRRPGAEPDDDQRDPGHVHAADAGRVVDDASRLRLDALNVRFDGVFSNQSPYVPFNSHWGGGQLGNFGPNLNDIYAHNDELLFGDKLTKVHGAHLLKFGLSVDRAATAAERQQRRERQPALRARDTGRHRQPDRRPAGGPPRADLPGHARQGLASSACGTSTRSHRTAGSSGRT